MFPFCHFGWWHLSNFLCYMITAGKPKNLAWQEMTLVRVCHLSSELCHWVLSIHVLWSWPLELFKGKWGFIYCYWKHEKGILEPWMQLPVVLLSIFVQCCWVALVTMHIWMRRLIRYHLGSGLLIFGYWIQCMETCSHLKVTVGCWLQHFWWFRVDLWYMSNTFLSTTNAKFGWYFFSWHFGWLTVANKLCRYLHVQAGETSPAAAEHYQIA
jgi:hypothetical protein